MMAFKNPTKKVFNRRYYYAANFLLLGLIFSLLFMHYRSEMRIHDNSVKSLIHQTEDFATSVSYFFEERKVDLENLAECRELSTFFENKALGMSIVYGLRFSRLAISAKFFQFVQKKTTGDEKMYSRLFFVDAEGDLLADTATAETEFDDKIEWKRITTHTDKKAVIIHTHHEKYSTTFVSTPYFFKDIYAGHLVAIIALDKVGDFFQEVRNYPSGIFMLCAITVTCMLPGLSRPATALSALPISEILKLEKQHM